MNAMRPLAFAPLAFVSLASTLALPPASLAQTTPAPLTQAERAAAITKAWQDGFAVAQTGTVRLLDQGSITLGEDIAFFPEPQARAVMTAMGNTVRSNLVGLVTKKDNNSKWIAIVSFNKDGYVRDADARLWDADELLATLKSGTEEGNKFRRSHGFPALIVNGWLEKPNYDSAAHRLIWSMSASREGAAPGTPDTVNYNTFKLGREGYFSLNMLSNSADIANDKETAKTLINALTYDIGKGYTDFKDGTDKVAAYGLATLVGGAALKKAGFFALIIAFFVKYAKLLGLLGIGAGALVYKLRKGKKSET
jgi:uncharacterized membrane-anchored protein